MSEKNVPNKVPEPGIHYGISFEEYCGWEAVNNSSLGPALKSAAHYKFRQDNPRPDTPAFAFGRLCHSGRLEPATVLDMYVVMPDQTKGIESSRPKSTKEYKARVANWAIRIAEEDKESGVDRQVVEQEDFDALKGVLDSLWNNTLSREWFNSPGEAEVSIVWNDLLTGILCKARIDKIVNDNLLADLKTTRDASKFEKSALDYGYDRQAAFYLDGWRAASGNDALFGIAAVEKEAPFGCRVAPMDPAFVAIGRSKYREALTVISDSRGMGRYAGYENPDSFEAPRYARGEAVLLLSGKEIILEGCRNVG